MNGNNNNISVYVFWSLYHALCQNECHCAQRYVIQHIRLMLHIGPTSVVNKTCFKIHEMFSNVIGIEEKIGSET